MFLQLSVVLSLFAEQQKSYSFAADKAVDVTAAKEDVVKVQLDSKLEAAMLDLIRKAKKDFQATRSVSLRLTTKKLTVSTQTTRLL